MKKLFAAIALAGVFAGCSDNISDAQRFGYKGQDLADEGDQMFFSTGPGVTNWVPTRVLSVFEQYDFSSNELALVAAAGVIQPAKPLKTIPEGYVEKTKEPWFSTWTKENTAFGTAGVSGFISHWNEADKVWETGETYFSSYYGSESEAVAALAKLETAVAGFAPLKFHRFDKCWIAEYLRLRVMGLAGQRPDGTWTCMLDIQDKCDSGCGQWEPVEMQQERVDEIRYRAEVSAWQSEVENFAVRNHTAVLRKAKAAKLPLFGEGVEPRSVGDGRKVYVDGGAFAMSNTVASTMWQELSERLARASGVKLTAPKQNDAEAYDVWYAEASNNLYTVRLDIAFPKPMTNSTEQVEIPGEWRSLCFENIVIRSPLPPPPQRKRR